MATEPGEGGPVVRGNGVTVLQKTSLGQKAGESVLVLVGDDQLRSGGAGRLRVELGPASRDHENGR